MLSKLHALYNTKLPGLYEEQYKLGYWGSYVEAKWITRGDLEPSLEDAPKPTRSMEPAKLSNTGDEARVLPVPIRERTAEGVIEASTESVIIIL